jgi:hypothetical protein
MKSRLPKLPTNFVDPITGHRPRGEVQMSGLLGLFHQLNGVDWSGVPLLSPDNCLSGRMADDLLADVVICSEYQLFWNSEAEMSNWGSVPADLICLLQDKRQTKSGPSREQNRECIHWNWRRPFDRAVSQASGFSSSLPNP